MDANQRPHNLHDMRTHLTVIKGYAQLARRECDRSDATPQCRGYLESLEAQIERMRHKLAEWERQTGTGETSERTKQEQSRQR